MVQPRKHNIVILGGNFAGVGVAHYILRHVFPALSPSTNYHITLVSPSDHTFYKVSTPRSISQADAKLFFSIRDAFEFYDSSLFAFVQGTATALDAISKEVVVTDSKGETRKIRYDSLVIATGTATRSPLWSLQSDHSLTESSIDDIRRKLQRAKSVIIAGGGPAGVETAGEISHYFTVPSCQLYSGGKRLLPRLKNARVADDAESKLKQLGVHVFHNTKVVSAHSAGKDKTLVTFDDGSTKEVDVFIDATGGTPNTGFLPREWLNQKGYVTTDMASLRVLSAPEQIYSIGDVASYSKQNLLDVIQAVPALGYTIWSDLRQKPGNDVGGKSLKPSHYSQIKADMQVVPIGPSGGVGVIFGYRIPNWLVWVLKSRTLLVHKAPELASGADYKNP
ncbi:FAD/NAD(P)-binding domain-containing protein [Aspergillus novoparasiticus]|uniref:FAD/NAD(P)-binding domain-containing protein n=1 Tax=Aspergillus novoparasiticus TaxID=986946 RepID=A0A5N6F681_9EURO|nr:FAD/NAD(P)-binding domain-containing protein [Aspergillus novoparasiticus]